VRDSPPSPPNPLAYLPFLLFGSQFCLPTVFFSSVSKPRWSRVCLISNPQSIYTDNLSSFSGCSPPAFQAPHPPPSFSRQLSLTQILRHYERSATYIPVLHVTYPLITPPPQIANFFLPSSYLTFVYCNSYLRGFIRDPPSHLRSSCHPGLAMAIMEALVISIPPVALLFLRPVNTKRDSFLL